MYCSYNAKLSLKSMEGTSHGSDVFLSKLCDISHRKPFSSMLELLHVRLKDSAEPEILIDFLCSFKTMGH